MAAAATAAAAAALKLWCKGEAGKPIGGDDDDGVDVG